MTDQSTQVLEAVQNDDIPSLASLKAGVDPDWANRWSDENGRGLLHHGVHNRSCLAVQWMVDHWPMDPDTTDNQGETPLMRAAWLGDLQSMETLIAAGADLNAQARTGGTALHYAHGGGHASAVDLLSGVDATIADASGRLAQEWKAQAEARKQGERMLKKVTGEPARGLLRLGRKG